MNAPVGPDTTPMAGLFSSGAPKNAQFVIELLRAGLQTLETNREAATHYVATACRVLETGGVGSSDLDLSAAGPVRGGLAPWQARRVTAYIKANLDTSGTMKDLAAVAHLGPSHFRRAFKKCFGVSPHAFLMRCRVQRAQELMLTTPEALSEIAIAAGFADQAHLTRRFHRAVGMTPGVWRRERRGDCGTHRLSA